MLIMIFNWLYVQLSRSISLDLNEYNQSFMFIAIRYLNVY